MDASNDFAFLCVGVQGDGEMWAFDRCANGFRGWSAGERNGGWIDEGDGGGGEFGVDGVL